MKFDPLKVFFVCFFGALSEYKLSKRWRRKQAEGHFLGDTARQRSRQVKTREVKTLKLSSSHMLVLSDCRAISGKVKEHHKHNKLYLTT